MRSLLFNKYDRFAFLSVLRMLFLMVLFLIFIFILIDFSENSDDFTDRGAPLEAIWGDYYFHYIPEMARLISPVALFLSILLIVGQMAQRLEIVALKAAGISMYRLFLPFLTLSILVGGTLFWLDSSIVPYSNQKRTVFEKKYIKSSKTRQMEFTRIYRQENRDAMLTISSFEGSRNTGYTIKYFKYDSTQQLKYTMDARRMKWDEEDSLWNFEDVKFRTFTPNGYEEKRIESFDTTLTIFPRDIARTSSDIYQQSYEEAFFYIQALERSGADRVDQPKVQLYGRLFYPFGCIVVCLIGFAISTRRLKGGRGLLLAMGLGISFIYLAAMKITEPLGSNGKIDPIIAVMSPHVFFLILGIGLLITSRK